MTTTYILMFLWWLTGVCSLVYWWTTEFDFTLSEIFLAAFIGVIGPAAFVVGWTLHTPINGKSKVLIKQRK